MAIARQMIDVVEAIGDAFDYVADSAIGRAISKLNDFASRLNPVTRILGDLGNSQEFQGAKQAARDRLEGDRLTREYQDILTLGGRLDVLGNVKPTGSAATRATPSSSSTEKTRKARRSKLNPEAFAREEAALNDEILRLKADEITDASQRADIELSRIEASRRASIADVQGDERYTAEQKKRIAALIDVVASLETSKAIYERDVQAAREALDIRLAGLSNQQDLLRADAGLADSRHERRAIELRLVDLAYDMERAELEAVIASKDATETQKKIAEERLKVLGQLQGSDVAAVNRRFASPLEGYVRDLQTTDINDQIEGYVVDELESVQDSIAAGISKAIGTKDPLITGLIELFIQQVIMRPIAEALAGQRGGGLIGGIGAIFGFASGGSMLLGGRGGTDTNVLSLNGRPIANVSRGERLNIDNRPLAGGGGTVVQQTFVLDARYGLTTPDLLEHVNQVARVEAARAGSISYQSAMRDVPASIQKKQRLG